MASDFDNQDPAAIAAPTPEESETKTDGKAGAKAADPKAEQQPSADKADAKASDPNGKSEAAAGAPGGRKRQGGAAPQANQKNGTLDLVELKDMSIQKLNQVAKDMNVAGAAGLRKQELIFKIL